MPVGYPDSRWYAIRTESRFEKIVRHRLVDRGVETLLPLHTRTSQWKNRTRSIEVALFPGYCFACFSLTERPLVLQMPGVLETLSKEDELVSIIAKEMAVMQRLVQTSLRYEAHRGADQGSTVEIIRGPLIGIRGRSLRRGDQSLVVFPISLIERAVAVEIQCDDLRAVAAKDS
jgi:transcription termination/antitermination protein NusG